MKRFFIFAMFLWTGIMGVNAQEDRCDVNGDGVVNIADVTYVIDHVLGKGHASTPQAIDLGLPSGTKWANMNVGSTNPEEYGGYYAWGEIEEKDYYDWSTYIHCDGSDDTCYDLGEDISGTEYDVAHVKWGGDWRMPTQEEFKELFDNCTSEWTTLNGVDGWKFASNINGNSIFLPAAGCRWHGDLNSAGSYGFYWSSTLNVGIPSSACLLLFHSTHAFCDSWNYRYNGLSVRPVR